MLEEGALWNVAFPDKQLRLEVMGVACAAHQALWEQETARSHNTRALHSALQAAQVCMCVCVQVGSPIPTYGKSGGDARHSVSVLVGRGGVTSSGCVQQRSFGG